MIMVPLSSLLYCNDRRKELLLVISRDKKLLVNSSYNQKRGFFLIPYTSKAVKPRTRTMIRHTHNFK